ncbi:hypothetical protein [Corynebacterium liangguodongii]|uniref:Uncharacterized protein n=1 Tax=Corynebacterium liangguodongii TaxID=2079535 RepID=A0A2S0WDZ7_9CORY|nr:hypothetical protein [Corynebacterium liangguodongii]AWB84005.1 hypothetical protein C3E79_05535 [Corynebacterium liangguodongii]PWC00017.1 hypothetical protein DF219_02175 [Corynebacterium liangguodongii]
MIVRKLGSPAMLLLGIVLVVSSVATSLWFATKELGFDYLRWPDVALQLREATCFLAFALAVVSAFNVAALTAPGINSASVLGKHPIHRQILQLIVVPAVIIALGIGLGFLPTVIVGIGQGHASIGGFGLGFLACISFLVTIASLAALLGILLRSFHPVISAVVALLLTYFLVALAANSSWAWAAAPINLGAGIRPIDLIEPRNASASALVCLLVACLSLALVSFVVEASRMAMAASAAAFTGIVGVAAAGQLLAGSVDIVDNDVCEFTARGTEVCVNAADAPGLRRAVDDVSAVEAYIPAEKSLAATDSFRIMTQSDYDHFQIRGDQRRIDVGQYVLSGLGIENCTDPTSEGAFVIDRVGVYILNTTGAYSKVVAENGAFYKAFSDSGEALTGPADELSQLPIDVADRLILDNWDAITSCRGTYEMF